MPSTTSTNLLTVAKTHLEAKERERELPYIFFIMSLGRCVPNTATSLVFQRSFFLFAKSAKVRHYYTETNKNTEQGVFFGKRSGLEPSNKNITYLVRL